MKLVAGIVTYNPDLLKLSESLTSLCKKNIVDKIIIFDNGSLNILDIKLLLKKYSNSDIICSSCNMGIAFALNSLAHYSVDNEYSYLLTLDQDSVISTDSIKLMLKYCNDDVGIVCPIINDLNKKNCSSKTFTSMEIDRCITSGNIINVKCFNDIGYFDEKMFIDYVDFDFCKRVRIFDYKIIKVGTAIIDHEIGKRTKRKFLFWTVYPTNHNPQRIFYYTRNIIYYCKKFKHNMTLKEKNCEFVMLLWKFLSILLYEKDKLRKLNKYFVGIKASKDMEV